MHWLTRIVVGVLSVIAVVLILGVIALMAITNTDRGRAEVLRIALEQLNNAVEGEVRVDRLEGNLLRGLRLIDVVIEDDDGEPLIVADTASTGFSLRGLARQRIILSDLRLVNADLTLVEPPGKDWNFIRIFSPDPDTAASESNWGKWIELRSLELVNANITMRSTWKPSDDMTAAEQERALREAMSEETRANVVAVEGGHQTVMEFRQLDALIERVLIAHPDTHGIPIDVDRFSGIVQPFRPPAADVRGLSGNFRIEGDSLFFRNVRASLPGSDLSGEGAFAMGSGQMMLRISAPSVALNDLRWLYPPLPEEGGGSLELSLFMGAKNNHILAYDLDVGVRESALAGRVEFVIGDTLYLNDTNLRFDSLDTRLIADMAPDLAIPRHGVLDGHAAITGSMASLRINADVRFDDHAGGVSHVLAGGHLGLEDDFETRGLRIELAPLQAELVRAFAPDAPLNGEIVGVTEVTGAMPGPLRLASDLTLRDPRTGVSRITARGGIDMRDDLRLMAMDLRFDPVRLDLVRPYVDDLPAGGTVTGRMLLDGYPQRALRVDGALALSDPSSGVSRISASGGVAFADALRFSDFRVQFDPVQLDLLRSYASDLPAGATLSGPVRLDGVLERHLNVDASLVLQDPETGTSHVTADGGVAYAQAVTFRDLFVRFDPLQMRLVRTFDPEFPLGGVLQGSARLDGSPESRINATVDLAHTQGEEHSAIAGHASLGFGPGEPVRLDMSLEPLSLSTVGRFAPEAGLHGRATGRIQANGTADDVRFDADLAFDHGGLLTATGRVGPGEPLRYDVSLTLSDFDLAGVTTQSPTETALTGTAVAEGVGTEPETMRARLRADFVGVEAGDVRADEIRLHVDVDDGLARIDDSAIHLARAEATFDGSFGLASHRSGTLDYTIRVDSLHVFDPFVPAADTGLVESRPAVREVALMEARERARRAMEDARVEFLATGHWPDVTVEADTFAIAGIPQDSLGGRVNAAGTISGNIDRFDVVGEVEVADLVYAGNYVQYGSARYELRNVGEQDIDVELDSEFETVLAGGFALEQGSVEVSYRGMRFGDGHARIELSPDADTDLVLDSEFALSLEGNELRLRDMSVRLDTLTWQSTRPGVVRWGGTGIELQTIELRRSTEPGRIWIDGTITEETASDLDIAITDLQIGHILALLQDDTDVEGWLDFEARLNGSLQAPQIEGSGSLRSVTFEGDEVPNLGITFAYNDRELTTNAELVYEGATVATMDASLPIDLSSSAEGARLLDLPLQIDFQAMALPVDALPAFTDQVETAEGTITANFSVRGTPEAPVVDGEMSLAMETLRLTTLGTRYDRIVGDLRMEENVIRVDSVVAWSAGPIRIAGDVNLTSLSNPEFDLTVTARDAWAIRTDDVSLQVDADLTISGPMAGVVVEGDVRTRRGVIYIPEIDEITAPGPIQLDDPEVFARADSLLIFQRDVVLEQSELIQNLVVDIGVTIDRDVWLRSTEANIEIYTPPEIGPLRVYVEGVGETLRLEGTINTDRGEYEYLSRRFNLTRGAVTFQGEDEINPIIQLAAEHHVNLAGREAFDIRIVMSGTMQDLEIELESTAQPPISQTDLLSFLAFGREASSMMQQQGSSLSGQGASGGGLVGNVAGLAAQQYVGIALEAVVNELERDAARAIGLDVIRITPAPLPAEVFTGGYLDILRGTEIEAGSYIASRMFVAGQVRPTFAYPGLRFEYHTPGGFEWITSFRPRYLPINPTLRREEPDRSTVFGSFVYYEWRF
jgi:translocation and assembly module TamB